VCSERADRYNLRSFCQARLTELSIYHITEDTRRSLLSRTISIGACVILCADFLVSLDIVLRRLVSSAFTVIPRTQNVIAHACRRARFCVQDVYIRNLFLLLLSLSLSLSLSLPFFLSPLLSVFPAECTDIDFTALIYGTSANSAVLSKLLL